MGVLILIESGWEDKCNLYKGKLILGFSCR